MYEVTSGEERVFSQRIPPSYCPICCSLRLKAKVYTIEIKKTPKVWHISVQQKRIYLQFYHCSPNLVYRGLGGTVPIVKCHNIGCVPSRRGQGG